MYNWKKHPSFSVSKTDATSFLTYPAVFSPQMSFLSRKIDSLSGLTSLHRLSHSNCKIEADNKSKSLNQRDEVYGKKSQAKAQYHRRHDDDVDYYLYIDDMLCMQIFMACSYLYMGIHL